MSTRRDFLKTGTLAALMGGTFAAAPTALATPPLAARTGGAARNIIFLVVDGMSAGTHAAANILSEELEGRTLEWVKLYQEKRAVMGYMDVMPADAIVTDSAASASAWGCGHRVPVRAVNMGVNGEEYKPILPVFADAGKATGLVTTTRITHATPAGFAANVDHREQEDTIAEQFLERRVDVLLGGGHRHLSPETREDGRDLYTEYDEADYQIARTKSELEAASDADRILGVFADGHLPYTLDRKNTPELAETVPTLAEMTDVALRRLSRAPDGFIMQIEGGRVDHGAHGNDAAAMLFDQFEFDEAIRTALAFAEERDDTLVVITTDHGTGNPALNRSLNGYPETADEFFSLQEFRHTNDWILEQLDKDSSQSQIRELVEYATRKQITQEEARRLQDSVREERIATYRMMDPPDATLGAIMANYTSVGWTGTSHTGDYVPVAALGPGCEACAGFIRNDDLFHIMVEAAGVRDAVPAEQRRT